MNELEILRGHVDTFEKAGEKIRHTADERQAIIDAHEKNVDEMCALARRFAEWASRHKIPFDYYNGRRKTKGHWLLTSDHGGASDSLGVNERGEIDARIYVRPTPARNKRKIEEYYVGGEKTPAGNKVYERVAEVCLEQGLGKEALQEFVETS